MKGTIWVFIVISLMFAASICYCFIVTAATQEKSADEVRIVHEYTEGYNEGYSRGKAQGLEDAIKAYEYYGY